MKDMKESLGVIIFGSVRFLPLKNNQTRRKKIEKGDPNQIGTGPNRPVWVRFLRSKTGKTYGYFSEAAFPSFFHSFQQT